MTRPQYALILSALALLLAAAPGPTQARSTRQAPQSGQARIPIFTTIQQQLTRNASIAFTEILQDADDEDKIVTLNLTVQVSDVAADAAQCRISYRQRVEKSGVVNEQLMQLNLREIQSIRIAAFESYENEWETVPGFVYTYTTPQITTVLLVHPDHSVNWFAFADADSANAIAADLNQALELCSSSAESKN